MVQYIFNILIWSLNRRENKTSINFNLILFKRITNKKAT